MQDFITEIYRRKWEEQTKNNGRVTKIQKNFFDMQERSKRKLFKNSKFWQKENEKKRLEKEKKLYEQYLAQKAQNHPFSEVNSMNQWWMRMGKWCIYGYLRSRNFKHFYKQIFFFKVFKFLLGLFWPQKHYSLDRRWLDL